MTAERISNRQACVLTVLYILANCFFTLYGVSAGRDLWISYIIAAAASCILWLLISAISDRYPDTDFFTLLERAFGRFFSRIIILLLALYAFSSIATSVANFGKFTQLTALSKTPQIIIPLFMILLAAYVLRSGIEVLARCASLLTPFIAFVFVYFLLFGAELIRPENLTPVLKDGIIPPLRASLSVFINQFGLTVLLTAIMHNIKRNKGRHSRGILLGVAIGSTAVCLIALTTVATLGQAQTAAEFHPTFTVLSIRNVGGFIQHMEILTSIASAFFILFRAGLGLYFLSQALSRLFNLNCSRTYLVPLALLIISTTQFLYGNTMALRKSVEGAGAVLLVAPLQFVIPVIACAILRFKKARVSDKLK